MTHPFSLAASVTLGVALAAASAQAQTVHRHRAHPAPVPAGHEITIHERGVEPWLTMGTWAPVGSLSGYATDTFRPPQRDSVEKTFVGVRGTDRLPNPVSLPQSNRPLIIVSQPGVEGPLFSWY
jgi:hypothetical protein